MVNRLIGVTLQSTADACSAMTCLVSCAKQLHCYDQRVKDDCENMLNRTGTHNCRLQCGSSESEEEELEEEPLETAAENVPAVPTSANTEGAGSGTLDLLRKQLHMRTDSANSSHHQPHAE